MVKRRVQVGLAIIGVLAVAVAGAARTEGPVIDAMEQPSFTIPKDRGNVEVVDGRDGKALHFSFNQGCQGVFAAGKVGATPEWDHVDGFSFWVKGDGSHHLGGLELVWNGDFSCRYAYAFPIDSTEWRKITVPWRDLVPELGNTDRWIDPKSGNAPSKLGPIWFGKWWYWRDYAAHSYTIDDVRLEPSIPTDVRDYRPAGAPLERVARKLKAGQPVTLVTMGDSLTDTAHWTNRQTNWPQLLRDAIQAKYGSEVRIVNPAMGGTELRQNVVLMRRWLDEAPTPDLVTVFFGGNDWNAGMRGPNFLHSQRDTIQRIRRATGGKSDVLVLTTCPSLENGETYAELADACRKAAAAEKAGLADVYAAFQVPRPAERPALFASDKVHLARAGQELVARTVLDAILR